MVVPTRACPSRSNWLLAALAGVLAGGCILIAIARFGAPVTVTGGEPISAWKGLLASPYGAIVEETLLRGFVMSALAWLLARVLGDGPRHGAIIAAIVLAAIAFGLGHLPFAAQLTSLDSATIARVVGYNALGGLVFGVLYWKYGLERAMLSHLCADIVLHVAAPGAL